MAKERFQDRGEPLAAYADRCLVHCPRCDRQAQVYRAADPTTPSRPRLLCEHCGYSTETRPAAEVYGAPVDPYFHQPLWLQTPCCGEVLWAYGPAHLAVLERYVRATLREDSPRTGPLPGGSRNRSLASRLPAWIKRAHNREDVLHGLAKLRERLG